ncbi:MAG TPA: GNAT family protein, partial [Anaerolineaceae bacterium]|nr:GNAT family protein [Anaerolineaceae bacterium]
GPSGIKFMIFTRTVELLLKGTYLMTTGIPGPAYRIRTNRLVIRCWEPSDAEIMKTAIDESVDHLRPWMPWAYNEPEELQKKIDRLRAWRGQFDLGRDFVYGVFSADESRVLGGSGLHTRAGEDAREIGYWIHKDYVNQGLATEVSAALTRVAFEIDLVQRVEIHCDPRNQRSAAVARKLGYTHEGTLRQRFPMHDGSKVDTMVWTLLAAEYPSSPSAAGVIDAYAAVGRKIISA